MADLHRKHRPRKRYGQHFLINERIADRIVESADIDSTHTVLEVGPGKGMLTGRILSRARNVFAVEIDRDLAAVLRDRFRVNETFHLIEDDILSLDLTDLFRDISPRVIVVSNIPYNISTPIIELLIRHKTVIARAVLMVQREVAGRLLAEIGTKEYGLTTLNLRLYAQARRVMDVKPGSFFPKPGVMSTVIAVEFSERCRYPLDNEQIFRTLTGVAFRQRRKMVRNTLIPYFTSNGLTNNQAASLLSDAGIDPQSRPERIDVGAFVAVSNAFAMACPAVPERGGRK